MKHIINTNSAPKIPYDGWTVESHAKMGKLDWGKIKPELYLSEKQKNGYIVGEELLSELEGKNPLNANVLDYLLDHPDLIPKEWRGKWIYFWGTIYRDSDDDLCVRCLYVCDGGSCRSDCRYVSLDFDSGFPALVVYGKYSPLESETLPKTLENLDFEITRISVNGRKYKLI